MQHRSWAVVGIATASLVGSVLVANPPASAASGTFTQAAPVTVTHDQQDTVQGFVEAPFAIPDQGGASSELTLAAPTTNATTTRVSVSLWVDHASMDDLDVVLVAPNGRAATLVSDVGGTDNPRNGLHISEPDQPFDDDSLSGFFGDFGAPVDYDTSDGDVDAFPKTAPASLATLGGSAVTGAWTLHVFDDTAGTTGSAFRWELLVGYGLPASPSPSELAVSGLPHGVADVNLVLSDVSGFVAGAEFLLESPDGRFAHVLSDFSAYDDLSGVDLTLDDEASLPIPPLFPPRSGTYRPMNYDDGNYASEPVAGLETKDMRADLAVFDGGKANGAWKLWVFQVCCGSVSISGWSLEITSGDAPGAPVVTSPTSGAYVASDTVTLSGTAVAGAEVRVEGSGRSARALATGGSWSVTIPDLPDGTHTFAVTQTDAASNTSAPAHVSVVVDTTRPRLLRSTPAKGADGVTPSVSPALRFTEALKPTSLTKQSIRLTTAVGVEIPARLIWNAAKRQLVINPRHDLAAHTKYRIAVKTGVRDLAGNRTSTTKRITFTTRRSRP